MNPAPVEETFFSSIQLSTWARILSSIKLLLMQDLFHQSSF